MKKFKYTLKSEKGVEQSEVVEAVNILYMMALLSQIMINIAEKGLQEADSDYRVVLISVEEIKE